jgi:ribonuclease Z
MRLTLLGTGTPIPDPARRGPSQVVQIGDQALLIDCGSGVTQQLLAANVAPGSIRNVLITHHHSDHTIDLAHFLFSGWIMRWWHQPPAVWGPPGTAEFVRRLFHAYELDLAVRMKGERLSWEQLAPACTDIDAGWSLDGDGWRIAAFAVDHAPVEPAFGFRVDAGRGSLAISGDTRPSDSLITAAQGVDLLVHEVFWRSGALARRQGVTDPEALARIETIDSYHTGSHEAGKVAERAGAKALALSHILFRGGSASDLEADIRRDYHGPIAVGVDLMSFDIEE